VPHPMRATAYVLCIALAALTVCTSNAFDAAEVDLSSGTWDASLTVGIYDAPTQTALTCTTSWTTAFDTTVYPSPDMTYVYVPDSATAVCPGFPDRPWAYAGMSLFATRSADTVILNRITNPEANFAKLIVRSDTKLEGTVDPYYNPRGPLVLTR